MKRSKISLAALAFILAISGTLAAHALQSSNSSTLVKNGWYGQRELTGETPSAIPMPNPETDCDGQDATCAIQYTNDEPGLTVEGGFYQL